MAFFDEFRKFIRRGNVIDLAVGIIIGAAFGKLVNSLVEDIIMPPIGALIGNVDFSALAIRLTSGEHPATIKYGSFLQTLITFIIIAFCVFLVVKGFNKLQEAAERRGLLAPDKPPPPEAPPTEKLLAEIRDLLKESRTQPKA
jgi:large conductance mechanosensitive channel